MISWFLLPNSNLYRYVKEFMKNRRKDQEAEGKLGEMSMEEETKVGGL